MSVAVEAPIPKLLFLVCFVLHSGVSLQCYHCAGNEVTLDGEQTENSTNIYNAIGSTLESISLIQDSDCLSSDTAVLENITGVFDTCGDLEVCGLLSFTLINEDYQGLGKLNITGKVRGCHQTSRSNECYNAHTSELATDPLVYVYFLLMSYTYGTGDTENEPQEAFGCYCATNDMCNTNYDDLNALFRIATGGTSQGVSLHRQPFDVCHLLFWICLVALQRLN